MHDFLLNFVYKAKKTVYKWWCVVYKPVYVMTHHGVWPEEKKPENKYPDRKTDIPEETVESEEKMLESVMNEETGVAKDEKPEETVHGEVADTVPVFKEGGENDSPKQGKPVFVDAEAEKRANEIIERLAREAAEDEAKKQAEIENAKRAATEKQRLAEILKSTERDISAYIEEGRMGK